MARLAQSMGVGGFRQAGDDRSLDRDLFGISPLLARLANAEDQVADPEASATSSPTALITPEKSRPSANGNFGCLYWPARTFQSAPFKTAGGKHINESGFHRGPEFAIRRRMRIVT